MKIVLIEDDNIVARILSEEFSKAGFEVAVAYDGEEGENMVKNQKPELIILDLVLPKKNGLEVLEALKKSPAVKKIPVIILSQLSDDENIKKGLLLGAADYIVKSHCSLSDVVKKIKMV